MPKKSTVKTVVNLNRNWGWLLGLGILFILLGFLGLGSVVGLTLVSIVFLGALFIVAGVAQFIDVFKSRNWEASIWHAIIAILYIVGGGLIMYDPILASTVITAIIAWILITMGIIRFIMAMKLRHTNGWFFFLLSSLAAIILGVLILMQWPTSGLWIIGLLISVELLVCGWTYVFLAFALRPREK